MIRALALPLLVLGATAGAVELEPLPPDKVRALGPLLAQGDLALIESKPNGRLRQISIFTLVPAPPELVRRVFLRVEEYPTFIRNLTQVKRTPHDEDSFDLRFAIDLLLARFSAIHRYKLAPDGAVDVDGIEEPDDSVFRWEFHPVPQGTVLVEYGYSDCDHVNPYVRRLVERIPSLEHGLALAAQMAFVRAVKHHAAALGGTRAIRSPGGKRQSLDFLLDRGRVAVVRSRPDGRLGDFSILDRIAAPLTRVEHILLEPSRYAEFIAATRKSVETRRTPAGRDYLLRTEVPLFAWETDFRLVRQAPGRIDVIGLAGDLRDAHYRWDLSALPTGGTLAVYRAQQELGRASPLIFGLLFGREPLFEHGLAVALGLLQVGGVRDRAEGRK